MEINGIATAWMILRNIKKGYYNQDELPKAIDTAISALEEQRDYMMGDNPDRVYGYPQTYKLPETS